MKKRMFQRILITLLLLLFYSIYIRFINGELESDFVSHIAIAKNGKYYSLAILIMKFAMIFTKKYEFAIALFMSLIILGTIYLCYFFCKYIFKKVLCIEIDTNLIVLIAISSIFICKICVPFFSPLFYKKSFVTQPWHNSTYLCMRLSSIPTLLLFYKIQSHYLDYLDIKECFLFTILLLITNYAKPNFIIIFAPIMLIKLIIDFIKTRTRSFKNALILGFCVLISCSILIYQSSLLFSPNDSTGITIGLNTISESLYMNFYDIFNIFSSLAFPLIVLVLFMKNKFIFSNNIKNIYMETWLMYILSIVIRLFISEIGERSLHGNFAWSSYFFAYMLFVVSICILIYLIKTNNISRIVKKISILIYAFHIISGIIYFILIYSNMFVFMT